MGNDRTREPQPHLGAEQHRYFLLDERLRRSGESLRLSRRVLLGVVAIAVTTMAAVTIVDWDNIRPGGSADNAANVVWHGRQEPDEQVQGVVELYSQATRIIEDLEQAAASHPRPSIRFQATLALEHLTDRLGN